MKYSSLILATVSMAFIPGASAQSAKEIEDFFDPKVAEYNQILEQNLDGYKIDWEIDSQSFEGFPDHKKISVSVGKNFLDTLAGYAIGREDLTNFYRENLHKVVFSRTPGQEAKVAYKLDEKAIYLTSDYENVINQNPMWDYMYKSMCVDQVCVYEFFYLETIAEHREAFNKELSEKYGTKMDWEIDHTSFRAHAPHNLLPAFGTSMREVLSAFTRHADEAQWAVISDRIKKVSFTQKEDVPPTFSLTDDALILVNDFRRAQPKQGEIWDYLMKNIINAVAE